MPDWNEGAISYDLPMFYSWNTGPVHFISINTEFYYYLNFGAAQLLRQYKWLINDLEVRNLSNTSSEASDSFRNYQMLIFT